MLKVAAVAPDSLAAELGLGPGTELLAINGRELRDFLDWEYLAADETFVLHARTAAGEEIEFDIERPEGLALGVTLEPPKIRRCANRCDFCFVDGNPAGARKSLLIRDDDYRLSFRYGNFATLTNLRPRDVARILEYRLSPLYISVHATNPEVRRRLLRNPTAPEVVTQLRMFAEGGIRFHAQIVLTPGLNDGPELERSLFDLYALGDAILTVAVVPVALTAFSRLEVVRGLSQADARTTVAAVRSWSGRARRARGVGWVYGSDELYLLAGAPLPRSEEYDGFPQVENGVGSVRYLQDLVAAEAATLPSLAGRRVLVCTGTAMGPLMPQVLGSLASVTQARFDLTVVANSYFGPSVTTAGLLPGEAIVGALREGAGADLALLPAEAVSDDGVFVDDVPLAAVEAVAPMPVRLSYHFTDALSETGS